MNSDDVDVKLSRAARVLESTYLHPYQMHGSMGSSCAVADVGGNTATIWSATQSVYPLRDTTAMVLGLRPEDVRVIFVRGSGCYGINGADTVSYDAALMSQSVGRPVRVQLSREDELAWGENYGLPYVIDQRAGVDGSGTIIAWDVESWSGSLGARPGYGTPGNVVTGALGATGPGPGAYALCQSWQCGALLCDRTRRANDRWHRQHRRPASLAARRPVAVFHRSAPLAQAPPEHVCTRVLHGRGGSVYASGPGRVSCAPSRGHPPPRGRHGGRQGRELGGAAVAADRQSSRWRGQWTWHRLRPIRGNNGYVALVAEVDVGQGTGDLAVKRFVVALDVGPISSPDGVRNQIEGGVLQGLSRAVGEEVTWDSEKVTSVDWATYTSLFLPAWDHPRYGVGSQIPAIETVLINRPDAEAMGGRRNGDHDRRGRCRQRHFRCHRGAPP